MKKLLFSLSLLASLATFAGESSVEATAQVYGVMPITSCASNVIVCVPWVSASSSDTNSPISVTSLIRTAELSVGDWIRVWDSSEKAFKVFVVDENKEWEASSTVTSGKTISATGSETLNRGDAVVLYRQNPGTSANPATFYVQGQYLALSTESTTVAKGSADTPAYTLIAPPITSGTVSLNSLTWSATDMTNDFLRCAKAANPNRVVVYQYNKDKGWGYAQGKSKWVEPTLAAGVGCWYVSYGGNPTITWKK